MTPEGYDWRTEIQLAIAANGLAAAYAAIAQAQYQGRIAAALEKIAERVWA